MTGLLRANALQIPMADESVDLIVFSPPYFSLRSYRDEGEHYQGQLGAEASPQAFLEALWSVMSECWRVLKPTGSCWVNLGDKRAGCVDEATDALTRTGWKRYDELEVGDEILTLNPDTYLAEWGQVEAVNVFPAQPRRMLRSVGRGHSSLTTEDHRWYVERRVRSYLGKANPDRVRFPRGQRDTYRYGRSFVREVRTSAELSGECRVPIAAPLADAPVEPKWSDALVEAVAWYWTEGSDRRPGMGRTQTTGIYIGQSPTANPAHVSRIERCLRNLFGPPVDRLPGVKSAPPCWRMDQWAGANTVDFRLNAAAARHVREHAPSRVPRTEWLASLTIAQLELFIEVSLAGDGWSDRGGVAVLGQGRDGRARAEAFQTACVLSGRAATLSYDPDAVAPSGSRGRWLVQVRTGRWAKPVGKLDSSWMDHDGPVWCPTTNNGSWLARRDGHVFFTGNSGGHNNGAYGVSGLHKSRLVSPTRDDGKNARSTLRNAPDHYNQNAQVGPLASFAQGARDGHRRSRPVGYQGIRAKSKMLLPHRFAAGCADGLADPCVKDHVHLGRHLALLPHEQCQGQGWIVRQDQVISKLNGLPESVDDRTTDRHELFFHLTKSPRYYAAMDELRESYQGEPQRRFSPRIKDRSDEGRPLAEWNETWEEPLAGTNPLGRLPGSVWTVASQPFTIPRWAKDRYDLPDHFAAFVGGQELVRRIVLGWSPPGVCTVCNEGRRPVVAKESRDPNDALSLATRARTTTATGTHVGSTLGYAAESANAVIVGYACACPDVSVPTRPAVVLDPFLGTGTTVGVANALGRYGVGIDLSASYLRLSRWRVEESGAFSKTEARTWGERQGRLL